MRIPGMAPALLIAGALLIVGAAAAQQPESGHHVTTTSRRAARDYHRALEQFHLGQHQEAVKLFEKAAKRDAEFALAQWGLSRALAQAGKLPEAGAALAKAQALSQFADDREGKLIQAWEQLLRGRHAKDAAKRTLASSQARRTLDNAISMYPDDPELWLLRAEAGGSELRAAPFRLHVQRTFPDHAFSRTWKMAAPPIPQVSPGAYRPLADVDRKLKLFEGLGKLTHQITTSNPLAQAHYEQGLRCWHSYVSAMGISNSAAQNFRYAIQLDPECAMAYWGLSMTERNNRARMERASKALELARKNGTDKERRFCTARILQIGGGSKREAFLDALEGAILAYPDDVELWIWRGKVHRTSLSAIPYQIAANRLAPEHPSPNHELVHAYEGVDRPALGWPYTIGFRTSAPNMPHANHMQAHLAMRLGRWEEAISATRVSWQKSKAGFPDGVKTHHIDILTRALSHEGRFAEAEADPAANRAYLPWGRLLRMKADQPALTAWSQQQLQRKNLTGEYVGALMRLDQGDLPAAAALLDKLKLRAKKTRSAFQKRYIGYYVSEVQGRYLIQTGKSDQGLKIFEDLAAKAVVDPALHAWGGGSYFLEVWGENALRARRWDAAQEAFLEALAHEHGSILGALGMQVVSEGRNQDDLAEHYAARATRIWQGADAGVKDRQLARLRGLAGIKRKTR